MWIKAEVFFIAFSSAACTYVFSCTNLNHLNINLLEDVKKLNLTSCARGVNEEVSISWLDIPPYIYEEKGQTLEQVRKEPSRKAREFPNGTEDNQEGMRPLKSGKSLKGIFYEIVNKGLQLCEVVSSDKIHYTSKAHNLQHLDQTISNRTAHIAMPVHGGEDGKYGGYEYVEILKSPGVVFIENKEQRRENSRQKVARDMKDTWPVLVITFLLAGLAGLLVWGLETSGNSDHFPRTFSRGVMEGIWWSFVSMTTVGYGDRVPKSLLARLFGILWILTGLVLCSFFTATFTSALTSSSIKQRESLLGVKVAVITNSHAYDEAMKHAANLQDYPDFDQMYNALMITKEVEGILADIYTASYFMKKIGDPRLAVTMFFSSQRSIGFVTGDKNIHLLANVECLRNLFKYRQRDIKMIVLQHTREFHTYTQNHTLTSESTDDTLTLLDWDSSWLKTTFYAVLVTFILMLTMGFTYECIAKYKAHKRKKTGNGLNVESIDLTTRSPTCKRDE